MARRKKERKEEEASEAWLLPYSDMLTLLLGLFIVVSAMSNVDSNKFNALKNEFSQVMSLNPIKSNSAVDNVIDMGETATKGKGASSASTQKQAAASEPIVKKELPKAIPQDISELMKHWKSILSEMGATSKIYLNKAVTSLGNSSDLILMFDDENAYEYLSENRAGCMDTLASLIEKRIGKKVEVTVKKNNSAVSAKEAVVDLTDMINFDIEEEN